MCVFNLLAKIVTFLRQKWVDLFAKVYKYCVILSCEFKRAILIRRV